MANFTWDQIHDAVGNPIVLLEFRKPGTKQMIEITIESLPVAAQAAILTFINNHIPDNLA